MTDQYYEQEDQLQETPERAIENFQAQSNSLANVVPEVATALEQTGQALGQLYDQAQAAGNTGAMALISASWERAQMIANQTVQLDALKQSAAAAIATIDEDRRQVVEQLSEYENALADGDESHPLLKEFAEEIRRDEYEASIEQAEEYALEYAHEVTYEQLGENIIELTGIKNWNLINRFIGILQGDYAVSDLQAAELKAFIEGLSIERDGGEPSWKAISRR